MIDARTDCSRIPRRWLFALAGCLAGVAVPSPRVQAAPDSAAPRPNVVILLCDDLGYGDLASYGHPHIRTPNLDRLAGEGVRLTSCYAAAPVCSSSRAGLLTGRNPNRSGIYDWLPSGIPVSLKTDEPTIPAYLRAAGYHTALVGKWHLNGQFNQQTQPQPDAYGFDHWMATQNNAAPSHQAPHNFVRNGTAVGPLQGFSCQNVADEAIRWLDTVAGQENPFYLHVCFHEPHEPVASPIELVQSYRQAAQNEDQAQYFANVTNMDAAVGKITAALDRLQVADDTLVFFTSDNGPETLARYAGANRSYGSAGPLREMKLHVYEGGIRVPGIVRWPARLAGGDVVDTPVSSVDVLPTLCELAGIELDTQKIIDGASLVPLIDGQELERQRPLFWFYYRSLTKPKFALRIDNWKLLASWGPDATTGSAASPRGRNINTAAIEKVKTAELKGFELYDLATDIGESQNVADVHPNVLEFMKTRAIKVHAAVKAEAPQWPETDAYWQRDANHRDTKP